MRKFARTCLALLFMAAVLTAIAWLAGFTPDGILYGHWYDSDDHPTLLLLAQAGHRVLLG